VNIRHGTAWDEHETAFSVGLKSGMCQLSNCRCLTLIY